MGVSLLRRSIAVVCLLALAVVLAISLTGCPPPIPPTPTPFNPESPNPPYTPTEPTEPVTAAKPMSLGVSAWTLGVNHQENVYQLQAYGGVPPYSWSIWSGKVPDGLYLDSSGYIRGTWSGVGQVSNTTMQLIVKDAKNKTAMAEYYWDTHDPGFFFSFWRKGQAGQYGSSGNPAIVYSDEYFYWVPYVQGGSQPWMFFMTGLPDGLTYDSSTGIIQGSLDGVPTGDYKVAAQIKDSAGLTDSDNLYFRVKYR